MATCGGYLHGALRHSLSLYVRKIYVSAKSRVLKSRPVALDGYKRRLSVKMKHKILYAVNGIDGYSLYRRSLACVLDRSMRHGFWSAVGYACASGKVLDA